MNIDEKIAETNSRIRRSGRTLFFDMQEMLWMITFVDGPPQLVYAYTEEEMRQHKICVFLTRKWEREKKK